MEDHDLHITIDKLDAIKELPTLPHIATQLITYLSDPDVSFRKIAILIEEDPPTVTKILRIVNSSYYSIPNTIKDIRQAIVMLGLDEIRAIVISLSVFSTFYNLNKNAAFHYHHFWHHSAGTAKMAYLLSRRMDLEKPELAYVCGLLHDIGRLILQFYFPENYNETYRHSQRQHISLYKAEEEILGVTHADVGYWIAQKWNLPNPIANILLYHHNVQVQDLNSRPLLAIVHLANLITNIWGASVEPFPVWHRLEDDALWMNVLKKHPGLGELSIEKMIQVFDMHLDEAEKFVDQMENVRQSIMDDHVS